MRNSSGNARVTEHKNGSCRRRAGRGFGASACCVGPLLLLSLGIGGAWIGHLTALEPYRPVFIVLTVLFLGLAFWKLYIMPRSCTIKDQCIAQTTPKRAANSVLDIGAARAWPCRKSLGFADVLSLKRKP